MDAQSLDFVTAINARARIAYCLAVVERALTQCKLNESEYNLRRESLDICWEWLEGNDDGMGVYSVSANTKRQDEPLALAIYYTLALMLTYISWDELRQQDGTPYSKSEHKICESYFAHILTNAGEIPGFQASNLEPLKQYLLQHHPHPGDDRLGAPITKEAVMAQVAQED